MQDFDKLKEMDIEELHRKTRITVSKLQDIMNRNFINIHHIQAHGFIKILERELNLNLQGWIEEYEQYQKYNNPNTTPQKTESKIESSAQSPKNDIKDTNIEPKYDTYNNKDSNKEKESKDKIELNPINIREITIKTIENQSNIATKTKKSHIHSKPSIKLHNNKDNKKTKKFMLLVFVAALVVLLIIIAVIYNMSKDKNSKETSENSVKEITPSKKKLYPKTSLPLGDALLAIENEDINADKTQPESMTNNTTSQNKEEIATNKNELESSTLTIIPKADVWFKWVNLDTKQSGNKYIKAPFSIQTKSDMIFYFANMILTFNIDGKDYNFNKGSSAYLLYKRGSGLEEISQKEYNQMQKKAI